MSNNILVMEPIEVDTAVHKHLKTNNPPSRNDADLSYQDQETTK